MKLVIVESPAKAKTIEKYLGSDYKVDASGGHVRDLPAKGLGVDIANNYKPEYVVNVDKKATLKRLYEKAQAADEVFLATDPDREGEAISWHLQQMLKLDPKAKNRIQFNEITKTAVNKAISEPRQINMHLVDAQQARRVLDRLVGYKLSPVLCKKIKNKLSGGRVQSAALKMIADREKEIKSFVPEEYWTVTALLQKKEGNDKDIKFKGHLFEKDGAKFRPVSKEQTDEVLSEVSTACFTLASVKKGVSLSYPAPPFTTSTMQQDASAKLGMAAKITMMNAQQLYEGVEIKGMGQTALVTYIRTDSVRISADAAKEAKDFLIKSFGKEYAPAEFPVYKSKKSAQDAHEAIRPVNLALTPASLKDKLQRNQYKLYELIYNRFLASQSVPAKFDTVTAVINAGCYGFKATGRTMLFDGYTKIYAGSGKNEEDESSAKLPELKEGQTLNLIEILPEQKFTKPPSRFTESSLIKTMEENGIGRPSTYSAILSTLYTRAYVIKEEKSLLPTDLGMMITEFLEKHFETIVDIEFTAQMEEQLDEIENGENWQQIVDGFFKPFQQKVLSALNADRVEMPENASEVKCEKCGAFMIYKTGRFGQYLACPNYPDCQNIKSLKNLNANPAAVTDIKCEKCGASMLEKSGRFGKYLACSGYPECKNTKSLAEVVAICPQCGGGVSKKISKKGTPFYGCNKYPDCKFVSWDKPNGICPKCGKYTTEKTANGTVTIKCSDKACNYSVEQESGESNAD